MVEQRRKLRVLVITLGGERQRLIEAMFADERLKDDFEAPVFCPGVHSRTLRARVDLLEVAQSVSLLPDAEWQAISKRVAESPSGKEDSTLFECLNEVPVTGGRRGSKDHTDLHYSVELWRKSKGLNKGRSVLACLLAHLRAMKTHAEDERGFDLICEDNIRVPLDGKAGHHIWQAIDASSRQPEFDCHLRYHGWLGSRPNLEWTMETFAPMFATNTEEDGASVFPFPIPEDIKVEPNNAPTTDALGPGGRAIWGAYAYWVSKQGYRTILDRLQKDVGALLWKGKRMRHYQVKPVDKVLPRLIMEKFSRRSIHVSTIPTFFRAPMLKSNIHTQWDPAFCRSTAYQLGKIGIGWDDLWLSEDEALTVKRFYELGDWGLSAKEHI